MKALVIEYIGITIILILGALYINSEINALTANSRVQIVPVDSQSLTVPNSKDANSQTDALQTVSGTNVYQNASVDLQ